jgi:predicted acyl esterase
MVTAVAADSLPPQQVEAFGANDIPDDFADAFPNKDFTKRVEMISMHDGVKLQTVILVPKGVHGAPILLTRTPYDPEERAQRSLSASLLSTLPLGDEVFAQAGYIRVYQDVRGKYGSEGDYVMMRPVRGSLNPTAVDQPLMPGTRLTGWCKTYRNRTVASA